MARTLEELKKQYNRAATDPKRGPGPGPRGPRGMGMGGKPKNARDTIRRIVGYIGRYKYLLILVIICMLGSTGTALVGSYMLRPIINNIADTSLPGAERMAALVQSLALLIGVYLVGVVFN